MRRSWQNVSSTIRLWQVGPDKTSQPVLTKRLPDKTSILTKRLLTVFKQEQQQRRLTCKHVGFQQRVWRHIDFVFKGTTWELGCWGCWAFGGRVGVVARYNKYHWVLWVFLVALDIWAIKVLLGCCSKCWVLWVFSSIVGCSWALLSILGIDCPQLAHVSHCGLLLFKTRLQPHHPY